MGKIRQVTHTMRLGTPCQEGGELETTLPSDSVVNYRGKN